MTDTMSKEQRKIVDELRDQGYAVVIFNPDELEDANQNDVEDRLIEVGWGVIGGLQH